MSNSARVGFHAAYTEDSGQKVATSSGNALVGAYLSQLGMSDNAIVYITGTKPDDIVWLTFADAQRVGIDVKPFDLASGGPATTTAPNLTTQVPATVQGDWSKYGEWIQIFSRPTLFDASQIATEFRKTFENTFVFKYANNWYGVVIGPFPVGSGLSRRNSMIASGQIPADSLIARGDRFVELAYGGTPVSQQYAATGSENVLDPRARAFFRQFHESWSRENTSALSTLNDLYADQINYYGKLQSKSVVMQEKRQFAQRWPERLYSVRPDSVSVSCISATRECSISGIVEWRAASALRNASSTGSAQYELMVVIDGAQTTIVGESGVVLNRTSGKP